MSTILYENITVACKIESKILNLSFLEILSSVIQITDSVSRKGNWQGRDYKRCDITGGFVCLWHSSPSLDAWLQTPCDSNTKESDKEFQTGLCSAPLNIKDVFRFWITDSLRTLSFGGQSENPSLPYLWADIFLEREKDHIEQFNLSSWTHLGMAGLRADPGLWSCRPAI